MKMPNENVHFVKCMNNKCVYICGITNPKVSIGASTIVMEIRNIECLCIEYTDITRSQAMS